jgi:hypothetical protein
MFKRYKYLRAYRLNQQAEKKRLLSHRKLLRKKYRAERRKAALARLWAFLANPFAEYEINPDKELRRNMRKQFRQLRKENQKRWIQNFRKNPLKTIFSKQKDEDKLLKEQWKKVDNRIAFQNRIRNIRLAFAEIMKTSELRKRFTITILQSTTYFILSFLFVYIVYQAVTILVAYSFNIPTVWYYYRVKFPLFSGSSLYTRSALISIFASGPLISLGLAFLFLKFFFNRKLHNQNLKLFYLWVFINGANFFFGSYIVGFITRTEFIYTTEWIFMSSMFDVEEIIFTTIAISISLLIGRLATPLFLLTSGSEKIIAPRFRLFYVINQVFLPWMIGVIVFQIITMPEHYLPLTFKTITPIFIILPSLFTYNSMRNENIHISETARRNYFKWSIVIAVIAVLFFYRVLLNFGLRLF